MKQYRLYIPVLALVLLAAIWLRCVRVENHALRNSVAELRAELGLISAEDGAADADKAARQRNSAELLAELVRVEEMTAAMQKEIAALEKKIPPALQSEVTESFGRITDMGAELGQYFRSIWMDADEAELRGITSDELSRNLIRAFTKFDAWAPEIGAMEDTPAEIASLQSSALRETFKLNEAQSKHAAEIIKAHFTTMKAAGLTYSSHDAPEWQERRFASLTELLWKLRPLIPSDSKQIPNLPQIVNIGAGFKSQTSAYPAGPPVPWLQANTEAPHSSK